MSKKPKKTKSPTVLEYSFRDWCEMKPGALLGGLILNSTKDSLRVGPVWDITEIGHKFSPTGNPPSIPALCFVEGYLNFREKMKRKRTTTKNKVTFYYPDREEVFNIFTTSTANGKAIKVNLVVGEPIGIFLGHIIRDEGHTFVNFLSAEGFDLWI